MNTTTNPTTEPTEDAGAPPRRKRRWVRRILIALGALIVLLVVIVHLSVRFAPVPAPLALPAVAAQPSGPLTGTWDITRGSTAGLRIGQTVLFADSDVVLRTHSVTGQLTATANTVTAATFTVDLTTLTDDGTPGGQKTPQVAISLDTRHHPDATVTITQPLAVDRAVDSGATVSTTARADLTLRGRTHPVTITLTAHRDGLLLRAAGSFSVAFADWDIPGPESYGPLGSLADHGSAEFLLVLQRSST